MEEARETVYDFSAPSLDGRSVSLDQFRGQVLLIVNTASRCGFTPQYAGLEQLYRAYRERGFTVLGFPSNQFGAQEPGSEAEIGALFAKIDVNGPHAHPLYRFLKEARPGILGFFGAGRIQWNFTKFLVDRRGGVVRRYAPSTKPKSLTRAIEELLDRR